MAAKHLLAMGRRVLAASVILAFPILPAWSGGPDSRATPPESPARLVRSAMESELAGHNDQREALLRQALAKAPDDPQTHWLLGQVRMQGIWMSPAEVAKAARDDPRLAQYRRLRDSARPTVADQAALARWCRKNRLENEARCHWIHVLERQPENAEAIKALNLRAYQGMLLPPPEIAKLKAQTRDVREATQNWAPVVTRWRHALQQKDEKARAAVLGEVRAIRDPSKLIALELVIRKRLGEKKSDRRGYEQVSTDLVSALKEIPGPVAAESLARQAVFSPFKAVTLTACAALKQRPIDHYAPLLLSWLATPIESSFSLVRDADGQPIAQQSFFREGPLVDTSLTLMRSTLVSPDEPLVFGLHNADPATWEVFLSSQAAARAAGAEAERNFVADAVARQRAVERLNAAIAEQNRWVCLALSESTGVHLDPEPTLWWDWWLKYNDWYLPGKVQGKKPTVECLEGYHVPIMASLFCSCFARGTNVWALSGRVSIEQVKAGDRVLSQDPETGELDYKPVLLVTIGPPSPMIRIDLGTESITSTPGHPFWAVGERWRLARQLAVGDRLHTLSGGVAVDKTGKPPAAEEEVQSAHNLIVADFHTYFVGERGILVHDNTMRKPIAAEVPGLTPQ